MSYIVATATINSLEVGGFSEDTKGGKNRVHI